MKVKWKHARSSFPGAAVMIATTWIGIMKRILAVVRLPNNLIIDIGNWSIGGFSYRFDVVRIEKRMGVLHIYIHQIKSRLSEVRHSPSALSIIHPARR